MLHFSKLAAKNSTITKYICVYVQIGVAFSYGMTCICGLLKEEGLREEDNAIMGSDCCLYCINVAIFQVNSKGKIIWSRSVQMFWFKELNWMLSNVLCLMKLYNVLYYEMQCNVILFVQYVWKLHKRSSQNNINQALQYIISIKHYHYIWDMKFPKWKQQELYVYTPYLHPQKINHIDRYTYYPLPQKPTIQNH